MKLHEIIHASTRPAWTARLVVFIAAMVAVSAITQLLVWLI
jgi:hypothetical protein